MQPKLHRVEAILNGGPAQAGGMDAIAARTVALWSNVSRALVPIIGQRGMSALYARALHLAAIDRPWLAGARGETGEAPAFSILAGLLAHREQGEAVAAVAALFDTFERLLVTLIGASLTERLLQPIWDIPSAGPTRQDTAP